MCAEFLLLFRDEGCHCLRQILGEEEQSATVLPSWLWLDGLSCVDILEITQSKQLAPRKGTSAEVDRRIRVKYKVSRIDLLDCSVGGR